MSGRPEIVKEAPPDDGALDLQSLQRKLHMDELESLCEDIEEVIGIYVAIPPIYQPFFDLDGAIEEEFRYRGIKNIQFFYEENRETAILFPVFLISTHKLAWIRVDADGYEIISDEEQVRLITEWAEQYDRITPTIGVYYP